MLARICSPFRVDLVMEYGPIRTAPKHRHPDVKMCDFQDDLLSTANTKCRVCIERAVTFGSNR